MVKICAIFSFPKMPDCSNKFKALKLRLIREITVSNVVILSPKQQQPCVRVAVRIQLSLKADVGAVYSDLLRAAVDSG